MATKANTRQKRKEDLIKQRRNRLLVARPHIFKFLNPSTSYKITDLVASLDLELLLQRGAIQ